MSHIMHAAKWNLPPCPKCGAWQGDPCRTPGWQTRAPHKERVAKCDHPIGWYHEPDGTFRCPRCHKKMTEADKKRVAEFEKRAKGMR
jgi:Zn finger protein HypA/HybF involved in hydrogenase expression